MWLQSFPMRKYHFTDAGYRFRKNVFEKLDYWIPFIEPQEITFWDTTIYNQDTFNSDVKHVGPLGAIAELWFRIAVDEVIHGRETY